MSRRFSIGVVSMVVVVVLVSTQKSNAARRHFGWRFNGAIRYGCVGHSNAAVRYSTETVEHQTNYEPAYQPRQAPEAPEEPRSTENSQSTKDDSARNGIAEADNKQRENDNTEQSNSSKSQSQGQSSSDHDTKTERDLP